MKKAALYILIGAVSLVAVVAVWLGWSNSQEQKEENKSSLDKAREAKSKLPELRKEAESLGIDHYGMSAKDLQKEIENAKKEDNGEDTNEGNSTKEITPLG